MRARHGGKHALITQVLDDVKRTSLVRRFTLPVRNQFETDKQPRPPHVPYALVALGQTGKLAEQTCADLLTVLLKPFLANDVEHSLGRGHGNRIATKSVEIRNLITKETLIYSARRSSQT
ncbi:hypothetical protein DFS13_1321 [Burkholderia sp. 28_3]|nr:hypothetical protein DFS13_1321 [Burkholderia sp. 28_3]